MTVEEAALLRAITAAPGDVTARLAYVDWLDEHGRSIEAAWVREEGARPPSVTSFAGSGSGCGYSSGYGNGYGDGSGHGGNEDNNYGHRVCPYFPIGYGTGNGRGDAHFYALAQYHPFGDNGVYIFFDSTGNGYGNANGDGSSRGFGRGGGDSNGSGEACGSDDDPVGEPTGPWVTHAEVHVPAPGEYVIVRSRDQGCVCGEYRNHHGPEVVLSKARQIYSWGDKYFALIDFAVVPRPCRLSREAPGEVVMLEARGIIPTTPEVEAFLRAHPPEVLT